MHETDRIIREEFKIKKSDTLPFAAWNASRITLAQLMGKLQFKYGAEIGVSKGKYSQTLCENIPSLQKLYSIDPWKAYSIISQKQANARYEKAKTILSKYDCVEIIRKFSIKAAADIPNESLDFIYIDGMHTFDAVILDLIVWIPKVRQGGIIAGHDYSVYYQSGVIDATKAYTYAHNIFNWYVTKKDKQPTFFWVNNHKNYDEHFDWQITLK